MTAYHRPRSLEEAVAIRAAGPVAVIAGGTDIYPSRAARAAWGDPTHADVLDITAIPGLDSVEETAGGWRIGPLVTWSRIARDTALPPLFDGLRAAAREVGGVQVQNRGTVVGNLCTASPAGDGIPNLLALDAQVELASRAGRRVLPLAQFLTGYRATALRPEELVTALLVPRLDGARGGFAKARRAALPRDLHRDGGRRWWPRTTSGRVTRPHRGRRLSAGRAAPARAGGGAGGRGWRRRRACPRPRTGRALAHRRHPRLRQPTAGRGVDPAARLLEGLAA
jgi:hypothetical protein